MKELLTDEKLEIKGEPITVDKTILNLDYKTIKKENPDKLDKYLTRWGELGFIEGLDGEVRERCAFAMEQLAMYLIYEAAEDDSINAFETIGFPMVRRVCAGSIGTYRKLNDLDLFDFNKFIKYSRELDINRLETELTNLGEGIKIDSEAEACALASEMVIERFNGNDKPFEEMKEEFFQEIKENLKKRYEGLSSDNTDARIR